MFFLEVTLNQGAPTGFVRGFKDSSGSNVVGGMRVTRAPARGLGLAQLVVVEPPWTMHAHPLGPLRSGERDMATISCSPGVHEGRASGVPWGHAGDMEEALAHPGMLRPQLPRRRIRAAQVLTCR